MFQSPAMIKCCFIFEIFIFTAKNFIFLLKNCSNCLTDYVPSGYFGKIFIYLCYWKEKLFSTTNISSLFTTKLFVSSWKFSWRTINKTFFAKTLTKCSPDYIFTLLRNFNWCCPELRTKHIFLKLVSTCSCVWRWHWDEGVMRNDPRDMKQTLAVRISWEMVVKDGEMCFYDLLWRTVGSWSTVSRLVLSPVVVLLDDCQEPRKDHQELVLGDNINIAQNTKSPQSWIWGQRFDILFYSQDIRIRSTERVNKLRTRETTFISCKKPQKTQTTFLWISQNKIK